MPTKKRQPQDLTTEEAIRKLFPKRVVEQARKEADEPSKPQVTTPKPPIKG